MDAKKSIEALQFFVTNLNAQSFQHKLQAKVFGSLGFHRKVTNNFRYVYQLEQKISLFSFVRSLYPTS